MNISYHLGKPKSFPFAFLASNKKKNKQILNLTMKTKHHISSQVDAFYYVCRLSRLCGVSNWYCLNNINKQSFKLTSNIIKVRKRANIRNRYNQPPHLTQGTNGNVTSSQLDITNESQEVSPFPAGDHKASINRRTRKYSKTRQK